jgi:hypothetical protein
MPKAVAIVVKGQRQRRRWSKLKEWLELADGWLQFKMGLELW